MTLGFGGHGFAGEEKIAATQQQQATGLSLQNKAREAVATFEFEAAEEFAARAVERLIVENGGKEEVAVALALVELGKIQTQRELHAAAAKSFREALTIFVMKMGGGSTLAEDQLAPLLESQFKAGDFSGAVDIADLLIVRLKAKGIHTAADIVSAEKIRGESLLGLGKPDEAQATLTEGRDRAKRALGEESPGFFEIQNALEAVRRERGEKVVPMFVGSLGNSSRWVFEGNETFPSQKLAMGLLGHSPIFLGSHPFQQLDDLLEKITSGLEAGYREAGFPDVKVSVAYDHEADAILSRISEGERVLQGEIHVEGLKEIDAEDFVRKLAGKENPEGVADEFSEFEELAKIEGATLLPTKEAEEGGEPEAEGEGRLRLEVDAEVTLTKGPLPFTIEVDPVWEEREPVDSTSRAEKQLRGRVAMHLFSFGFPQAKFEIEKKPSGTAGVIDLIVRVTDEGVPCTLGTVQVNGCEKNSAAEVIEFLGLEAGQRITPDMLRKAKLALWRSGRFKYFEITAALREPGRPEIDVVVDVAEVQVAPPLNEKLAPEVEVLIRLARMLSSKDLGGNDLVMTTSAKDHKDILFPTDEEAEDKGVGKERIEIAYASSGRGITMKIYGEDTDSDSPFMVAVGSEGKMWDSAIHFGGTPLCWRVSNHAGGGVKGGISLVMDPGLRDDGSDGVNFGFAFGMGSLGEAAPFRASLVIAPAAIVHEALRNPLEVSTQSGVMMIRSETLGKIRVEVESGRLIEWTHRGVKDISLKLFPGIANGVVDEISEVWNSTPKSQRIESSLMTLFGGIAAYLAYEYRTVAEKPATENESPRPPPISPEARESLIAGYLETFRVIEGALRRFGGADAGKAENEKGSDHQFSVPFDMDDLESINGLNTWAGSVIISMTDAFLPKDSWLTEFSREVAFYAAGQRLTSLRVFKGMLADPRIGPVGCLLAAKVLQRAGHPMWIDFVRRSMALTRVEDFRRDWKLFTGSEWIGKEVVLVLLGKMADLSPKEIDAFSDVFPELAVRGVGATAAAFETNPDQSLDQLIGPAMDALWDGGLAEDVELAARKMLEPPKPKANRSKPDAAPPMKPGIPAPGRPGYIRSPHDPDAGLIDVRGLEKGTKIRYPFSSKVILVP